MQTHVRDVLHAARSMSILNHTLSDNLKHTSFRCVFCLCCVSHLNDKFENI